MIESRLTRSVEFDGLIKAHRDSMTPSGEIRREEHLIQLRVSSEVPVAWIRSGREHDADISVAMVFNQLVTGHDMPEMDFLVERMVISSRGGRPLTIVRSSEELETAMVRTKFSPYIGTTKGRFRPLDLEVVKDEALVLRMHWIAGVARLARSL